MKKAIMIIIGILLIIFGAIMAFDGGMVIGG